MILIPSTTWISEHMTTAFKGLISYILWLGFQDKFSLYCLFSWLLWPSSYMISCAYNEPISSPMGIISISWLFNSDYFIIKILSRTVKNLLNNLWIFNIFPNFVYLIYYWSDSPKINFNSLHNIHTHIFEISLLGFASI